MRIPSTMEERANAITHGLGLGAAVAASSLLMNTVHRNGGNAWHVWGCGVYVVTLIATYAASTFSHVFEAPRVRHALRAADQAIIFLFIAGCWTPIAFAWMRGVTWGWLLLGAMWAAGLIGFISKSFFNHRVQLGAVSLAAYLFEGGLPVLATWPMLSVVPHALIFWFYLSGLCYLSGAILFVNDHRFRFFHAGWHIAVLAGTACHYVAVIKYCTGP